MATPGASPVPEESAHPSRPAWAELSDEELLKVRFADLNLTIEGSWLEARITDLYAELTARGLTFRPHFWLSVGCRDGNVR